MFNLNEVVNAAREFQFPSKVPVNSLLHAPIYIVKKYNYWNFYALDSTYFSPKENFHFYCLFSQDNTQVYFFALDINVSLGASVDEKMKIIYQEFKSYRYIYRKL